MIKIENNLRTEIERRVERYIEIIDRLLMAGTIDQETYDNCMREINERSEKQYAALTRCK